MLQWFQRLRSQPPEHQSSPFSAVSWSGVVWEPILDRRIAFGRALNQLSEQPEWDFGTFREVLRHCALLAHGTPRLPDTIDLSPLAPTCEGLYAHTRRYSKERGKVGFIDIDTGTLVWGVSSFGTSEAVQVKPKIPTDLAHRRMVPVISVHTHPVPLFSKRGSLHLSVADFVSFLGSPVIFGEMVIADRQILLAVKTQQTPRNLDCAHLREEFRGILEGQRKRRREEDAIRAFTKLVCRRYELGLYFVSWKRDWIGRTVPGVRRSEV